MIGTSIMNELSTKQDPLKVDEYSETATGGFL